MATDSISGAVKVVGLPDLACFTNFADFVQKLADSLVIEIPDSITNVVVGNSEPADPTTALWVRQDNSGTFVGLYAYTSGAWAQIYPVPGQLTLIYGSSLDVPAGWQIATDDPNLTADEKTFLEATWMDDPDNVGEYLIFHVTPSF